MKKNDWKERLGVVYSTNPDYEFETAEEPEIHTVEKSRQKLRLRIEKNGRGGKVVTVVSGFVGNDDDLKDLSHRLKTACGVGGSVKNGEIIIQGEFKQRLVDLLKSDGYSDTK